MSPTRVINIPIEEELKSAYIDYAMSVIVARALPDVRDGLKPVQRRILYAMYELGLTHNKPFRKSARIVGEVLGKYHPHGDASVYNAMTKLAQDWVMRYPLIDGQGNFGSIDGDEPAAMRYTEARLSKIAEELLVDIDKDTVDFINNFDGTLQEPTVLPSRIPNLLANGSTGIAVGMRTEIPPHNMSELIDGIIACIKNPEITTRELMSYIKGPDFPTGGIICGVEQIRKAYETGAGAITIRARINIETETSTRRKSKGGKSRKRIVITEIPYQTRKTDIIKKIASLVENNQLQGIEDLRDESDRTGIRIVIDLKEGVDPQIIIQQLYNRTELEKRYYINNIALVDGKPVQLSLKDLILEFIRHRLNVLIRKTRYELRKAEERAHILEGLLKALDNIDLVISIIRSSPDPPTAKQELQQQLNLSEKQAQAILDMRLQRLTALERTKLQEEFHDLQKLITRCKNILSDPELQKQEIINDLLQIKQEYGDERKTEILDAEPTRLSAEELIVDRPVVVLLTKSNHLQYISIQSFIKQLQPPNSRKILEISKQNEDYPTGIWLATTRKYLLLFSASGKMYMLAVHQLPDADVRRGADSRRSIRNYFKLRPEDHITTGLILPHNWKTEPEPGNHYLIIITRQGYAKKLDLQSIANSRISGTRLIHLKKQDEPALALLARENQHILVTTRQGLALRIAVSDIPISTKDNRQNVPLLHPLPGTYVVSAHAFDPQMNYELITITSLGFIKRTPVADISLSKPLHKPLTIHKLTEKTGIMASSVLISEKDIEEPGTIVAVLTESGHRIKITPDQIPSQGRITQGARILRINDSDRVILAILISSSDPLIQTGSPERLKLFNYE